MQHHDLHIHNSPFTHFVFSGGEVHCKLPILLAHGDTVRIICYNYTSEGIMAICMYNEIVRRQGASLVHLELPYVPYARQDRVMAHDEPFSLKVFADIINAQKFDSVLMVDPHSDVAPALINNSTVVPQHVYPHAVITDYIDDENVLFVSPDAGAYKKLSKLIHDDNRIIIATKMRGPDGSIQRTRVMNDMPLAGRTVVIVDDICDGGRTFIELGKTLRELGVKELILYVTHGIFSKGFDELAKYFDHIYTSNSFPNQNSELVTVTPLAE